MHVVTMQITFNGLKTQVSLLCASQLILVYQKKEKTFITKQPNPKTLPSQLKTGGFETLPPKDC